MNQILQGSCLDHMRAWQGPQIDCVVTSPPYWGLRDYGVEGQYGLEPSPTEYVDRLVELFAAIRPNLSDAGTVWLNLGDSYAGSGKGPAGNLAKKNNEREIKVHSGIVPDGLKPKDLVGVPWRVAFALQQDGWWLRSAIVWAKPNPMPESVRDRPTSAHEYVFLLTKSADYWYDADAIRLPASEVAHTIRSEARTKQTDKQRGHSRRHAGFNERWDGMTREEQIATGANARSVWTIATRPFKEAHFATMPVQLAERCILAGCPKGGLVYDPFFGAGTTGVAALNHGRLFVGSELNTDYIAIAERRLAPLIVQPMLDL